jgi:hypothetical protein
VTVFLGCGFVAKYREGGGVFSVPLQWMLGLKRLQLDAVWLEVLPGSGNETADRAAIKSFVAQLRFYGLAENYCLLYQPQAGDAQDLARAHFERYAAHGLLAAIVVDVNVVELEHDGGGM